MKEKVWRKWNQQPHVAVMKVKNPERYERSRRALEAIHNFMKAYDEEAKANESQCLEGEGGPIKGMEATTSGSNHGDGRPREI